MLLISGSELTKASFTEIICSDNKSIIDNFIEVYPQEIDDFADEIYNAYTYYKSIDKLSENEERNAYIAAFLFAAIKNLIDSFHLLLCGYWIPSGNLMRQFMESTLIALLFSRYDLDCDYFGSFKTLGTDFKAFKAFHYVEKNLGKLDINEESWREFKAIKQKLNLYSHSSALALCGVMDFSTQSAIFRTVFDEEKKVAYVKEIKLRISAAKSLKSTTELIRSML